jgi:hypothetical protein
MFGIDDAVLASAAGGLANNLFAGSRQEDAQAFSASQFASRYQTTVKDMQAAGLNPMLAYSQGGGSAPTSSAAGSSGFSDLGNVVNQSKMNAAQVANIHADTSNKEASAELIAAQAAQARASASQQEAMVGHIGASIDKIREETKNIPVERDRIKFTIQQLAEDAALKAQQGHSQVAIREEIAAKIAKLRAETKILGFDIDAASDLGNLGRETQQLKPALDLVRGLLRK